MFSRPRFAILVTLLACICIGTPALAAAQKPKQKPSPRRQVLPTKPSPPAGSPVPENGEDAAKPEPQRLSQMPASPPQVTYQNGQLTIVAENSTLGDVLREVRRKTSTPIDVPSNATERVVATIGPAPLQQVLVKLLNGSAYNYVILGSNTASSGVDRVIVTTKPTGPAPTVARTFQPPVQAQPMAAPQEQDNADDNSADDDPNAADAEPAPSSDGSEGDQEANPQTPPTQPGGIKTPEQLLQELQLRQQQMQLQMQQPNQQQPMRFPNQNVPEQNAPDSDQ